MKRATNVAKECERPCDPTRTSTHPTRHFSDHHLYLLTRLLTNI